MDDKSILEKIVNEVPVASRYDHPKFYEDSDGSCFVQFYSTMEPEMIIEAARKYLHMHYYSIFVRCLEKNIRFISISIYKSGEREAINFGVDLILSGTELDNGFIYKYKSPYSYSTCYVYIPNLDVVLEEDRPSRKKEILALYCKILSYDSVNREYKKYTGKGISEATYLKYNLG